MALIDIVEPIQDFGSLEFASENGVILDIVTKGYNSIQLKSSVSVLPSSGDYVYVS